MKMKFEEFKEMIEEFVADNFCADSCRECNEVGHEIIPNDFGKKPTDYDKAIKNLYKDYMVGKNG